MAILSQSKCYSLEWLLSIYQYLFEDYLYSWYKKKDLLNPTAGLIAPNISAKNDT